MPTGKPTEEELRNRMTAHLAMHDSSDTVALIWEGYIAALVEWGLISPGVHERLAALLPQVGNAEIVELLLGSANRKQEG